LLGNIVDYAISVYFKIYKNSLIRCIIPIHQNMKRRGYRAHHPIGVTGDM
jgi:hypothetical protein